MPARTANKLSAVSLKSKRPGLHADGGGLNMQVTIGTDGEPKRSWLARVRLPGGKVREIGLGSVVDVGLAEARHRRAEVHRLAKQGIDPVAAKKAARAAAATEAARIVTFRAAAKAYIDAHAPTWKNAKHAAQWGSTLEAYAFPVFGDVAVADVDQTMVMRVLDPIWHTKTETASRLRGRIEAILDWATVRGMRSGENPARWRGHLQKALPPRSRTKLVVHHAAMPRSDLPAFMAELREREGVGARCLEFLILTAARYGEASGARWVEIDMKGRVWTVPAARMKAGREHRVPLSSAAMRVLDSLRPSRVAPEALVFESAMRHGAKLSDATLTAVMRRMGRSATVHGFRSSYRDWAAEETDYAREVAEAALAHAIKNGTEAAYRRGDLFDKRREMMEEWAAFCGGGKNE